MKVPTITLSIATILLLLSPPLASANLGNVAGKSQITAGTIELAQSEEDKKEKDANNPADKDKKKKKKKKKSGEEKHNDEDDC